jgi:BirA family transcriptional regulator, biotin operon repressor / biotin---[acetyl-CoA-carboxylase] ligase
MPPQDLAQCEAALRARGRPARILERTGSTNDDARAWAAAGAVHGSVVIADAQDRGRGRHGRAWTTPPGASLAMSIVLRPRIAPHALAPIALVAGLAAREAIGARCPRAMVKWPNDVVIEGRKIAGILVEGAIASTRVDHVVVGIGVNVTAFPPDLIATSIAHEGGDPDRSALALDILDALDRELEAWLLSPASIGKRLEPYDALRDREVLLENGTRGVACGIADDGRLCVRSGEAMLYANAGEVRAL